MRIKRFPLSVEGQRGHARIPRGALVLGLGIVRDAVGPDTIVIDALLDPSAEPEDRWFAIVPEGIEVKVPGSPWSQAADPRVLGYMGALDMGRHTIVHVFLASRRPE